MYKKLAKTFIGNNVSKFILIIFCISFSLTGYVVSSNLVSNIQRLIESEAKPVLGGDIKLEPREEITNEQISYLDQLKEEGKIELSTKIQTFSTIVDKNGNPDLASLVFVEDNYPLYGDFIVNKTAELSEGYFASQSVVDVFEQDGELEVYDKVYKTAGIIERFPEAGVNFYDEGKKIVLPLSEFYALGIDQQVGARMEKEYLIKVNNPADFETILSDLENSALFERVRINDYKSGGQTFAEIFSELDTYVKYVLIISFLLTILVIFLSVESFYIRNKKTFSILKILGLGNTKIIIFNLFLFSFIFLISYIIAVSMSYIVFSFIREYELASDFSIVSSSLIDTAFIGITILAISVIIPLIKFFSNNPLAGLKENFLQVYSKREVFAQTFLVALGIIIIYILSIGSFVSAAIFTGGLILGIFIISSLYFLILKLVFGRLKFLKKSNYSIYDAMRNTIKPGNLSILISFGFIVSFTSLLFISILSLNFLNRLDIDLSNDNNVYIVNIPDEDVDKIDEQYRDNAFSIILARITSINTVSLADHVGERQMSGRFSREFNITDNSLSDVELLEGKPITPGEVSVDDEFAQSLGVKMGDSIEFLIYGKKKELTITNVRKSQSGTSLQPFFYFQVHPLDFTNFPKNYFLATYIEPEKMVAFKTDILEKTGSYVSFIEIDQILEQVKSISNKALTVIQVLFFYVFFFCIASLIISVLFLLPFKQKKSRLYYILGASKRFISTNNISEYIYLQILALIISIAIASGASYFLLGLSDFISFSWSVYFQAIGIIGAISIAILILVFILTRSVNTTKKY